MEFPPRFVVAGIGTDVGKTVVSAILCAGLKISYWKPVQSGLDGGTDTERVQNWSQLPEEFFLKEAYRLNLPASPHLAAKAEGIQLQAAKFDLPSSPEKLMIELAGGLFVPMNENGWMMIDLLKKWALPVVLVAKTYLGSINHSLLSIEALRHRNIRILGIVFNEGDQPASETAIAQFGQVEVLASLPHFEQLETMDFAAIFQQYF